MRKTLIIATHPDDEVLGAGGYILKEKNEGNLVYVINITNVKTEYGYSEDLINERNNEIEIMKSRLNLDGYYDLKYPPIQLTNRDVPNLIQDISKVMNEVKPDVVILPFQFDAHSDHRHVFEAAYSCTKIFRYPFIRKVLMMETTSETDFSLPNQRFKPNYYINISDYMDEKIDIAKVFDSEILNSPFPRSEENIRAYGQIRGAESGNKYAESFEVIKIIE